MKIRTRFYVATTEGQKYDLGELYDLKADDSIVFRNHKGPGSAGVLKELYKVVCDLNCTLSPTPIGFTLTPLTQYEEVMSYGFFMSYVTKRMALSYFLIETFFDTLCTGSSIKIVFNGFVQPAGSAKVETSFTGMYPISEGKKAYYDVKPKYYTYYILESLALEACYTYIPTRLFDQYTIPNESYPDMISRLTKETRRLIADGSVTDNMPLFRNDLVVELTLMTLKLRTYIRDKNPGIYKNIYEKTNGYE